jgi:hypothetical protein
MRITLVVGLFLIAATVHAQELARRPEAQKTNDFTTPITAGSTSITPGTRVQKFIMPNTPIPDGMVWVEDHNSWVAQEQGSCAWCGRPMTFKQAAFDNKSISMWALRSAVLVADIEISHHRPCFQAGTCFVPNPLLGNTRAQGYAVAGGLTLFAWMGTAKLRAGRLSYHVGGYRHWWIVPVIAEASSAVGIVLNLATWNSRH